MYNTKNEDKVVYVTKSDKKLQPEKWQLKLMAISDRFDEFKNGNMTNIEKEFKNIDKGIVNSTKIK